jgi:hypothetical protein
MLSGFARRWTSGSSPSPSSCTSATPLIANGVAVLEVSSPLSYMTHPSAKSSYFFGDPHSVTGARARTRSPASLASRACS